MIQIREEIINLVSYVGGALCHCKTVALACCSWDVMLTALKRGAYRQDCAAKGNASLRSTPSGMLSCRMRSCTHAHLMLLYPVVPALTRSQMIKGSRMSTDSESKSRLAPTQLAGSL